MDIDKIYGTIFPMSIDDNNRYAELKGDEINIIQLSEPTIRVKEIVIPMEEKRYDNSITDRQSYRIPVVEINDVRIEQVTITDFCLDLSGFMPKINLGFVDIRNKLLSATSLKDGSILKIYIGGLGDESYYKPIRLDFIVTEIKKISNGNQNMYDQIQYRIFGKLNIPMAYKKEPWSNSEYTSSQELFNVASYLGLGYSTNFEGETNDKMKWENTPNSNYIDFINEISSHACYSPNTFFTSFIDQYYVLNFVECHRLLSHGGNKTDIPAIIYSSIQPNADSINDKGEKNEFYKNDKNDGKNSVNSLNNPTQRITYYYISNNEYFNGWTNFIEEYVEITNGGYSTSDGYRRNVSYTDSNAGNWGMKTVKFSIPPIDNIMRNSETQNIESYNEPEANENTYIPVNLVQTNQVVYQDEMSAGGIDDISSNESYTYYGDVDTSNTFKLYYYAKEQNTYQMNCMKRYGLKVKLQNYNPSITKFSRIWVDIYDKNMSSNMLIRKYNDVEGNKDENNMTLEDKYKLMHNDSLYVFDNEGVQEKVDGTSMNRSLGLSPYNRALSGWYVVTELKYVLDKNKARLNTIMVLNRIEKKPLFKNEYYIARDSIEKYKEDNVIEKLINTTDDYSYAIENMND